MGGLQRQHGLSALRRLNMEQPQLQGEIDCHCERSEAIHWQFCGLLRRFTPRNDGYCWFAHSKSRGSGPAEPVFQFGEDAKIIVKVQRIYSPRTPVCTNIIIKFY